MVLEHSLVLVQPRKTRPCLTERLLMGLKESNQTNSFRNDRIIFIILINEDLVCFNSRPNITALGEVLEEVEALNVRLQPHLQRFTQIVRDDAQADENVSL